MLSVSRLSIFQTEHRSKECLGISREIQLILSRNVVIPQIITAHDTLYPLIDFQLRVTISRSSPLAGVSSEHDMPNRHNNKPNQIWI